MEAIKLEMDGGLARMTFTQPDRGNPIDARFCQEFGEVAVELSENRSVRAVLITAEGKAFGYGGDISQFVSDLDSLPKEIKRWTMSLHMGIARMQRMDAPIVAAVHGACAGGMAGTIAGSDIVLIEPETKFIAAYPGIGFCCDASSSITLSRRMGMSRARRFLLLNETIGADEAISTGLADMLVDADLLVAEAEKIARKLASGPTKAYGEIRRLMMTAEYTSLETQLEFEAQALARCAGTADAREGLTAFAEKRKAQFKGE